MKTFKKILRYLCYAGIVIGAIMIMYCIIRNQNLFSIIKVALKDSNAWNGFKIGLWGVLVIIISLVLFICSFSLGRKKEDKTKIDKQ